MIPLTPSVEDMPEFQTIRIGSAPVIRQLIDEMGLIERIDKLLLVKAKDCNVSVGTRIAALIINQLSDRKPLFKVEEFYEKYGIWWSTYTLVRSDILALHQTRARVHRTKFNVTVPNYPALYSTGSTSISKCQKSTIRH